MSYRKVTQKSEFVNTQLHALAFGAALLLPGNAWEDDQGGYTAWGAGMGLIPMLAST